MAFDMYLGGKPITEIAKKLGASRQIVRLWLERAAEAEAAEPEADE